MCIGPLEASALSGTTITLCNDNNESTISSYLLDCILNNRFTVSILSRLAQVSLLSAKH